ncbi:nitroreductase family protein [Anaerorhabdus sp.]|jgi:nitroreductase|uniref:nitroreductase family protein n=1 Tax=Anaerorhabdus sp. TaxID=1872524 RepID=UPI002FC727B6
MDTLQAIKTRSSIRKYTNETISNEQIHQLLEAGFCAPSAKNRRPWHFVVVQDKGTLIKLADFGKYYKMLTDAPLAIIVCGDSSIIEYNYLLNDCSAATQNILLAAHELGLGAVWLGIKPEMMKDFYAQEFNLPENMIPVSCISIGHPNEVKEQKDRFEDSKVHYEKFSAK